MFATGCSFHNFARSSTTNFSKPSRTSLHMPSFLGTNLSLLSLSQKTCVKPPTAFTSCSPCLKMPTSNVALVLPSFVTRRPQSTTAGYATWLKKLQPELAAMVNLILVHDGVHTRKVRWSIGAFKHDCIQKHIHVIIHMMIYIIVHPFLWC
jgi:hypothetical protein